MGIPKYSNDSCYGFSPYSLLHSDGRKNLPADLEVFFDVLTVVFFGTGADFAVDYYPKAFIPLYA